MLWVISILGEFMYYIFYKTTNLLNKKVYYGVHKTEILDDGYLGSGIAIKKAIKKYGKQNFNRETIKFFDTREEMYSYEKSFVTEELVKDVSTYNQTLGGFGGFSHIDNYGDKNPMKNPEIAAKVVQTKKQLGLYHTPNVISANNNNLKKAIEHNTGKKRPEHSITMSSWAKNNWQDNKEKIRNCLSSYFCLTSPTGVEYRTNRLEEFCKVNDLPYTTIWKISSTGISPKKGKAKDWYCFKEQA